MSKPETRGGARRGAGRPRTGRNVKAAAQVRLTPRQRAWLTTAAAAEGMSVAEFLGALLRERGMPE